MKSRKTQERAAPRKLGRKMSKEGPSQRKSNQQKTINQKRSLQKLPVQEM